MEISELRYFYQVAKDKGFSRAARALHVQQPTLSRAVQDLELKLKVRLFERTTRSVNLTDAGQRLFEECRKLFSLVDQIPHAVTSREAELQGKLEFAISDSFAQDVLPRVLEVFSAKHPRVIPSVAIGPADQLFRKIELSELEFGIFFSDPSRSWKLNAQRFRSIPCLFAVARSRRHDEKVINSFISAREIEDGRPGEDKSEWDLLKSVSPAMQAKFSSNSYLVHRAMVLQGLGVSIFPEFMIRRDLARKKLVVAFGRKRIFADLFLVSGKNRPLSSQATAFLEVFKSELDSI